MRADTLAIPEIRGAAAEVERLMAFAVRLARRGALEALRSSSAVTSWLSPWLRPSGCAILIPAGAWAACCAAEWRALRLEPWRTFSEIRHGGLSGQAGARWGAGEGGEGPEPLVGRCEEPPPPPGSLEPLLCVCVCVPDAGGECSVECVARISPIPERLALEVVCVARFRLAQGACVGTAQAQANVGAHGGPPCHLERRLASGAWAQ